mmetsp:Transcript_15345/g.25539  ORF Transcript_15345/g.25539 Transcript_15345/m.25539 type:complete len:1152 (-) Transcript_15345:363-3818(-)
MSLSIMTSAREDWELFLDEANNYYYWYNKQTGETKWDNGYELDDDEFSLATPATQRVPMSPHHQNKKIIDPSLINKLFRKHLHLSASKQSIHKTSHTAGESKGRGRLDGGNSHSASSSSENKLSDDKSSSEDRDDSPSRLWEDSRGGAYETDNATGSGNLHSDHHKNAGGRTRMREQGASRVDTPMYRQKTVPATPHNLQQTRKAATRQPTRVATPIHREKVVPATPQNLQHSHDMYAADGKPPSPARKSSRNGLAHKGAKSSGQDGYTHQNGVLSPARSESWERREEYRNEDYYPQDQEYQEQEYPQDQQYQYPQDQEYQYQDDNGYPQDQEYPSDDQVYPYEQEQEQEYAQDNGYPQGQEYPQDQQYPPDDQVYQYEQEQEYPQDSGYPQDQEHQYPQDQESKQDQEYQYEQDYQYDQGYHQSGDQHYNEQQDRGQDYPQESMPNQGYAQNDEYQYQQGNEYQQSETNEQSDVQSYDERQNLFHEYQYSQEYQQQQAGRNQARSNSQQNVESAGPSPDMSARKKQHRLLMQAWGDENSTRDSSARRETESEDEWGDMSNVHLTSMLSPEEPPVPSKSPKTPSSFSSQRHTPQRDEDDAASCSSSLQYSTRSRGEHSVATTVSGGPSLRGSQIAEAKKSYSRSHSSPYDHKTPSYWTQDDETSHRHATHDEGAKNSPSSPEPWGRQHHVRSYRRAKTWQHDDERSRKGREDSDAPPSGFTSPPDRNHGSNGDNGSGKKPKVVVPALNMMKIKESQSANRKRATDSPGNSLGALDSPASPSKKKKDGSFVAGILESICDEKKDMQTEWESKVFVDDTSLIEQVFDPRVSLKLEESDVTLLEVYMYLGCVDDMMDLYLAYPTERFIQYVTQASEQYSIIMQGNAMGHEECIRVIALHGLLRECRMKYLMDFYDFSSACCDADVIAVLQMVSIDDIIYKHPFVSYTSYAMSHPLPHPLPEDEKLQPPAKSADSRSWSEDDSKRQSGFRHQIQWLFDALTRAGVSTYGQLMTYTTEVFQGHALYGGRGELRSEFIAKALKDIGGTYAKQLLQESKKGTRDGKELSEFVARCLLLTLPVKLETYFYECCVHARNGDGYHDYQQFGPSVGGYLLCTETEWNNNICDILQLMALGHAHKLPEFSTYYQVKPTSSPSA